MNLLKVRHWGILSVFGILLGHSSSLSLMGAVPDPRLRPRAEEALDKAITFFTTQVAVEGTYLWAYSADLKQREGEGVATKTQGWVQPPGTPAIGMILLEAFLATGKVSHLAAAQQTGLGLVQGQLRSGGWTYSIDFDPKRRKKYAYRIRGGKSGRNTSTLDDDTTQAAVRFLIQLDAALHFRDATIHHCVTNALDTICRAQYPNGAWPQGFDRFPDPEDFPIRKADYPESWPRQWPGSQQYWKRYTFNDNVLANTIQTLFVAEAIYGAETRGSADRQLARRSRVAAEKAGDFIVLAQMPEPQPAWAQQYDFDMHPSWARKFEPPSITGGESQGVLRTLLDLYRRTGQTKYLDPVPGALAYLQRSRLPIGQLARFYELKSNRPLYFTRDYQLTYSDANMPTHYGFKVRDNTESIERAFRQLKNSGPGPLSPLHLDQILDSIRWTESLEAKTRAAIKAQDDQGRWIEPGPMPYHRPKDPKIRIIRSSTFINHTRILIHYLAATRR